ncbi:MAG: aroB [Sphingobacteriales bacterium]|nr:aroB [Sphingobacteriales bacterium]
MMDFLQQSFTVNFQYGVYFTEHLFNTENTVFSDFLAQGYTQEVKRKILFVIDQEVATYHPDLISQIDEYFSVFNQVQLVLEKVIIPGGEIVKNDEKYYREVIEVINRNGIDRHSYVAAIGGGSVLDMVGYASAISHRGIKHIRIPATVLSQNDSGVGVKNGINYLGKKNFLGTFVPPTAVFNDFQFLTTLSDRHWRSGISEAIKVSLIRDASFFEWLEQNAQALVQRDKKAMQYLIKRCAELHLQHIASGDPFEKGSSRPLDFGHWSAHKLEQITNFEVFHGEAVAIGIALDTVYSQLTGLLTEEHANRVIQLLLNIGLPITHSMAIIQDENSPILLGLQEFREHLGGQLTIMLLKDIGKGEEVHEMDHDIIKEAAKRLSGSGF